MEGIPPHEPANRTRKPADPQGATIDGHVLHGRFLESAQERLEIFERLVFRAADMDEEYAPLPAISALDGHRRDRKGMLIEPGTRKTQIRAAQLREPHRHQPVRLQEQRAPTRPL